MLWEFSSYPNNPRADTDDPAQSPRFEQLLQALAEAVKAGDLSQARQQAYQLRYVISRHKLQPSVRQAARCAFLLGMLAEQLEDWEQAYIAFRECHTAVLRGPHDLEAIVHVYDRWGNAAYFFADYALAMRNYSWIIEHLHNQQDAFPHAAGLLCNAYIERAKI